MNHIAKNVAGVGLFLLFSGGAGAQSFEMRDPIAAYKQGDYATCVSIFEQQFSVMKWPSAGRLYDAGCCMALAGMKLQALDMLKRAVDAPDFRSANLANDPDLTSLHDSSDWPALVEKAQAQAKRGPVIGAGVDIVDKNRHPPVLPAGMRVSRDADVVLVVAVTIEGKPDQIIVEQSSGDPALDQVAIAAASRWKYIPGDADGTKFPGYVRVPFHFKP